MKKYNYTKDVPYKINRCCIADSFGQLEKALKGAELSGKKTLLIAEKRYAGFYKEQLSSIFGRLFSSFEIFEMESNPSDLRKEAETLNAAVSQAGLSDTGCVASLGGYAADALSRVLIAEQLPEALYLQLPVTFVAQLTSGKSRFRVLEASLESEKALSGKALTIRPSLIYINVHAYQYLSDDERLSGMGEVLRCAVSSDRQLFHYIENNAGKKTGKYAEFLLNLLLNCLEASDGTGEENLLPGNDRRAIYGYTLARGLEKCTNFIIPHGSAAGIGMVVANSIAAKRNLLSNEEHFRIARLMTAYGLSVSMNFTDGLIDAICAAVRSAPGLVSADGRLREFALIDRIGHTIFADDVTIEEIKDVMNYRKF